MTTKSNGLKGKFYLHSGLDHYRYGKIVDQLEHYFLLIKPLPDLMGRMPTTPMLIVHYEDITTQFDSVGELDSDNSWCFFDTERELRKYIDWLEREPSGDDANKVVKLHSVEK